MCFNKAKKHISLGGVGHKAHDGLRQENTTFERGKPRLQQLPKGGVAL